MKTKLFVICLLVLAIAGASTAFADNTCKGNDAATWSADSGGYVAVGQGGTGSITVDMTSPSCLEGPIPGGTAQITIDVQFASFACSQGDTSCSGSVSVYPTVSIPFNPPDPQGNPQPYTGTSQTQTYKVAIDGSGATPGIYTYHVHANASENNVEGIGWGFGGGVDIFLTVLPPSTSCDSDQNPVVTFSSPTATGNFFCSAGTPIHVAFSATGTSNINAMSADVNLTPVTLTTVGLGTQSASASGDYSGGSVGAYVAHAYATDVCGKTGSAENDFSITYKINGLQPPLAGGTRAKGGSDAPIKIIPIDNCTGLPILTEDSSVRIEILSGIPGTTSLQDSTIGGCTGSKCGVGGDTTVRFDPTTGQYITNFQTDTGAGNKYTINVYFGGVLNLTATLTTSK